MPFAILSKYEEALEKFVAEDIIEKVEHSEWASPTVPIVKPNDDLRICGDYSVTINRSPSPGASIQTISLSQPLLVSFYI